MAMARDGKMFSGRQAMLSHERKLPAMGGGGGAKKLNPLQMPGQGGGQGGEEPQSGELDPSAVVAEHGPANDVHITHDHAAGKHHVTSTHEDGHVHESEHASAEEAGEHAKMLGSGGGEEQPDELEGAEYE
jgi:hypothetical protein